ncbi:hypothetical protein LDVICp166 [lymphocystis disease virus-China]|uniref:Uncharacterized protein n=1 Tax=lymphocystis disease virus-China TaxID=256729 RepID=Q677U6_9VIRU|nr:hypothetical protein LDVICp166 [lymphocystis disease virus-China]AAU11011.1 hypothetical protein [lymphocystis disease virus-China]
MKMMAFHYLQVKNFHRTIHHRLYQTLNLNLLIINFYNHHHLFLL